MPKPTTRTIVAFGAAFLLIGLVETAYRATGGTPAIRPGYTPAELRWRAERTSPRDSIYVIGDSRVGWGFSETAFDQALVDERRRGVNVSLPAGSIPRIFSWLLGEFEGHRHGIAVLALSPAGLYAFQDSPGAARDAVKLQDVLDERVSIALAEHFFTYGRRPESLLGHFRGWATHGRRESVYWAERILSPGGLAYGRRRSTVGSAVNDAEVELIGYRRLLRKIVVDAEESLRMRRQLVTLVRDAQNRGWRIAIARFPVGPTLLAMEDSLPGTLLPGTIAEEAGTVFFDYTRDPRVRDLRVADESHLAPEDAQEFSRILAADVAAWLNIGD